jgi:hypothetical protein
MRILAAWLLAIGLAAPGCVYDSTLMSRVRAVAADLRPPERKTACAAASDELETSRSYEFACGHVAVEICRNESLDQPVFGHYHWTVVEGSSAHLERNPDARCSDGCCEAAACEFAGLDRAGDSDAADCIRRWRRETCEGAGFREGKQGRVRVCRADGSGYDVFIESEGWDRLDDVE